MSKLQRVSQPSQSVYQQQTHLKEVKGKKMETPLVKLQKEWYKKLKDNGFNDLEYFDEVGQPKEWLKGTSKYQSPVSESHIEFLENAYEDNELIYSNTLDYYLAVSHSVDSIPFDNEVHKQIWELHGEGLSLREIAKIVNFSHPKVLRILNHYRNR